MKHCLLRGLVAVLGMSVAALVWAASDEATVKALYLYNFTKFIDWPDEQRSDLRLCVMGNEAFGKSLNDLIGKKVRSMQLSVRQAVPLQDVPQCDLLFVPSGYTQPLERVRQVVNGYPILIVTESADVLPKGAVIALIPAGERIVFEVDLTTARQLGLKISAKMLQLARKVY